MLKKMMKLIAAAAMGAMLCVTLTACSSAEDKAYPVSLDGTEIMVGETTVSALYDNGYTIRALDTVTRVGSVEIEASYQLGAEEYYTGMYVQKDGVDIAMLEIVSGDKAIPVSEAVIASLKVKAELDHPLDNVLFDGVPLPELTSQVFQEHVPGSKVREDGSSAYIAGKNYTIRVMYENGAPVSLEVERSYNVDYSS